MVLNTKVIDQVDQVLAITCGWGGVNVSNWGISFHAPSPSSLLYTLKSEVPRSECRCR